MRRWGEAARRAKRQEISDGEHRRARSIRAVREAYPLSQRELGVRAGLARSTIAALEGGRRAQPATMRAIALALGVKVGEIAWPR